MLTDHIGIRIILGDLFLGVGISTVPPSLLPETFLDIAINDSASEAMELIVSPEPDSIIAICVHFPSESIQIIILKMTLIYKGICLINHYLPSEPKAKLILII